MTSQIDKTVDMAAERSVLSTLITNRGVAHTLLMELEVDFFSTTEREQIFSDVKSCLEKERDFNWQTLKTNKTPSYQTEIEQVRGEVVLRGEKQIEKIIEVLSKKSDYRYLLKDVGYIKDYANPEEYLDVFCGDLASRLSKTKNVIPTLEDTTKELLEIMQGVKAYSDRVIQSNFPSFDKETNGGFLGGELIILAAPPSTGKTAYMITVAARMILNNQQPVIFSYEMSRVDLLTSLISSISVMLDCDEIATTTILNPHASKRKYPIVEKILGIIKKVNPFIFGRDTVNNKIDYIINTTNKLIMTENIDGLFVDYAGLLIQDSSNEREELAQISRKLKRLASANDIPVFLLSQMNIRDGSKVVRPNMGMLKGSSTLEADSDFVLFLWRKWIFDKTENIDDAILFIAKSRRCFVSDVELVFDGATTTFGESENGGEGGHSEF